MTPLHKIYFDVVHKIILHKKVWKTEANYLDMALMELLDSEVKINLPGLLLKHMNCVLH